MPRKYGSATTAKVAKLFCQRWCPQRVKAESSFASDIHINTLERWYSIFVWRGDGKIGCHDSKQGQNVRRKTLGGPSGAYLLARLEENPLLYLREMQQLLKAEGLAAPDVSNIYRFLVSKGKAIRVTDDRAKNACNAEATEFKRTMARLNYDPKMLLFLDETHKTSKVYKRRRGWFNKGTTTPVTTSLIPSVLEFLLQSPTPASNASTPGGTRWQDVSSVRSWKRACAQLAYIFVYSIFALYKCSVNSGIGIS
mgnify:CR=1 FL=1